MQISIPTSAPSLQARLALQALSDLLGLLLTFPATCCGGDDGLGLYAVKSLKNWFVVDCELTTLFPDTLIEELS